MPVIASPGKAVASDAIQDLFSIILALSILVSAINHGGHPTFPATSDTRKAPTENYNSTHSNFLEGFLSVLVRKDEILAGIIRRLRSNVTNDNSQALGPQLSTSYHFILMQMIPVAPTLQPQGPSPGPDTEMEGQDGKMWGADDPNKPISLASIIALANPRNDDGHYFPPDGKPDGSGHRRCKLVSKGTSCLQDVLDKQWDYLIRMKNGPLQDHIATVQEYLEKYQTMPLNAKHHLFFQFSTYVVLACWRKMLLRIEHWSSQGFIYQLGMVGEEALRNKFSSNAEEFKNTKRRDSDLGELLISMTEKDTIQSHIMGPCGHDMLHSDLTQLLARFKEILKSPRDAKTEFGAYTKATCFEFHQLLVATLISYGKALHALSTIDPTILAKEKAGEEGEGLNKLYEDKHQRATCVWRCALLLWRIAYSQMLYYHLKLLSMCGWLRRPLNQENILNDAHKYTGFSWLGSYTFGPSEEDEEYYGQVAGPAGEETVALFRNWVQLQVRQLGGLQIITATMGRATLPDNFEVSLVAVEWKSYRDPKKSWPTAVKDLLKTPEGQESKLEAEDVIKVIRAHVARATAKDASPAKGAFPDKEVSPDKVAPQVHPIIRTFRNDNPTLKYNGHCEMLLASLTEPVENLESYIENGEDSESLIALLKDSDPTCIEVTKYCCPVCWEGLDVLRGEDQTSENFNACGRHPTPFLVDLPPWFSQDAAEKMVTRISKVLLSGLVEMVANRNARHRRFPSLQSNAGGISPVDDESPIEERDNNQDIFDNPFVQPLPVACESKAT